MKKIGCIILVFLFIISLTTGCGVGTKQEATTGTTASAETKAVVKEVTLSLVLITGHDPFQASVEKYMIANPNAKIDVQQMPTDQFQQNFIKTKFAAGDAPDVFPVFATDEFKTYFKNGYIADLSDMTDTIARLAKGADETSRTDDGKLMCLPIEGQLIFIYYNKDMFISNGLSVPKTWDEFLNVCKVLKGKGVTPISQGFKDSWMTQMIPYALSATLVHAADPQFHKGTAVGTASFSDNKGWNDIMEKFEGLIADEYLQKGLLSTTFEQSLQMFANEQAGMTVNGTWAYDTIKEMNPAFEIGGFQIPGNAGDTLGASFSINGGYGISANSANLDEAKKLLAYMVSAESLKEYLKGKGPSPYSDVDVELASCMKEVVEMEKGQAVAQFDNVYWLAGVAEVFMKDMQAVAAGQMKGVDVLKDMDKATESALKKK